jgi:hypothetical protein
MLSIEKLQKYDPVPWQEIGIVNSFMNCSFTSSTMTARCLYYLVNMDSIIETKFDYFKQFQEILKAHAEEVEPSLIQWFIVMV